MLCIIPVLTNKKIKNCSLYLRHKLCYLRTLLVCVTSRWTLFNQKKKNIDSKTSFWRVMNGQEKHLPLGFPQARNITLNSLRKTQHHPEFIMYLPEPSAKKAILSLLL
jgi:hypothetical protein